MAGDRSAARETDTGDLPIDELRDALHRVAERIADYLATVGERPVLPSVSPGEIAAALPAEPPEQGEPLDRILDDVERLIEPGLTHWNHPGFLAYFGITGSGPGILGEALAATYNVNAMLWRTGPVATELEARVCDWLRRLVGLPDGLHGHINDTASTSSLVALAAARHRADPEVRERGVRRRFTLYCSEEAHSSIDKAAMTLGLGLDAVRRVPVNPEFRLRPQALAETIAIDRAAGHTPFAVVATIGTTSTTSVDPLGAVAEIAQREGLWLHVDAAYAGPAAALPEKRPLFAGWERADSIVINPHKWLFTPVDCSVLLTRRPDELREAFAVVPAYLRSAEPEASNLMDLGFQLGRRFRALKLWMVLRAFGAEGVRRRIAFHCELAQRLAADVERDPGFELAAPVPFSTVCFRALGADSPEASDALQRSILEAVNRDGRVFLSGTELAGRWTLRMAIGNLRTDAQWLDVAWELVRAAATRLREEGSG